MSKTAALRQRCHSWVNDDIRMIFMQRTPGVEKCAKVHKQGLHACERAVCTSSRATCMADSAWAVAFLAPSVALEIFMRSVPSSSSMSRFSASC